MARRSSGPDGKPVILSGYPHKDNVEFLRNWYPSGLAGTGSGEYAVKEHVLEAKWFASANQENKYDDPIFHLGLRGATYLGHTGWALGVMKRALEEVARAVKAKRRGGIPVPVDEYSLFQFEFVRIESLYQSSRAWATQVYRESWDSAIRGGVTDPELLRLEQVCTHVNRVMNDVVNTAALWSGSAVIPHDSILGRLTRDMRVGAAHSSWCRNLPRTSTFASTTHARLLDPSKARCSLCRADISYGWQWCQSLWKVRCLARQHSDRRAVRSDRGAIGLRIPVARGVA